MRLPITVVNQRMSVCTACPHSMASGRKTCGVDSLAIGSHVQSGECPLGLLPGGKVPDSSSELRRTALANQRANRPVGGCGCQSKKKA